MDGGITYNKNMTKIYNHTMNIDTIAGPEATVRVEFCLINYAEIRILKLEADGNPLSLEDISHLLDYIYDEREDWRHG